MKKLLNPSLALCATLFFAAHAPAQRRPAQTKVTPPPAQVKPVPIPAPTPVPTPAPEPFDGASAERMAAQCVRLETESGTIEIMMLPDGAPETVRNFLNLAATGAFDTTTFSRVVRGFVIQGGNLSTREKLTPPALAERARRTVRDEPNAIRHTRGVVSMARSDRPHSATTNFFILVGTASHLDNKFAAFGRVTKGMDVVDAINKAALEGETPLTPVRVASAAVFACAPNTTPDVEN